MDSRLLTVRFPGGTIEFTSAAQTPSVGDKLRRGGDEWLVIAVESDENGNAVVTLAPIVPGTDGNPKKAAS
jgi:hypothetical protein